MSHTLQALQPLVMHLLPPTRAVRLTEVTMESAKVCLQLTTTAVAPSCPRCAVPSSVEAGDSPSLEHNSPLDLRLSPATIGLPDDLRYQNRQAMFVVTGDGVIATDPIGYGQPQAVTTYLEEIRKVTPQPVKYLIYSHHHYDHIAGGQPFKDVGATVIAHRRAKERLAAL